MNIETYQDEDSLLWGYILYDRSNEPVASSAAIYNSASEARNAACSATEEADLFF